MARNKIKTLRNKADRLMQGWGRRTYKECMVCKGKYCCLHHYYPKSKASALRYDEDNLIPICNSCHLMHHTGSPDIHNKVNEIKGKNWYVKLKKKKEKIIKINIKYYESIIERYKNL